jgi:hypothetical protein
MLPRLSQHLASILAGAILAIAAIFLMEGVNFNSLSAQQPGAVIEPNTPLALSQVLNYQGRLLSPTTGQPKPDGDYQMSFGLYQVETGGAPLWQETKNVAVKNGLFSVLLGDTQALPLTIFNGQELFLGITLANDTEMTPRQRLAHTAYAIFAENAGNADSAKNADNAKNAENSDNAGTLDGIDAAGFAVAQHSHSGEEITSGIIDQARIDGAIARDSEILPAILAADGPDSGLNADTLDGLDSTSFSQVETGTEFDGKNLESNHSEFHLTQNWSPADHVIWEAVPTTAGGQVNLTVTAKLENGKMSYILTVLNNGAAMTDYTLRYSILR